MLLYFFFLFRVAFNNIFAMPVEVSKGAPITVTNDSIKMLPLVADKTIKELSKIVKRSNTFAKHFAR